MAHSIVMPALEMAQESGKLIAWRKKEGETIAKGEPLLEVETDKAVVEVESPADGILAGVKAHEGDVVPVGQTIAWIVQPGESRRLNRRTWLLVGAWMRRLLRRPLQLQKQMHQQCLPPRLEFHRKRGGWPRNMGSIWLLCADRVATGKFWLRIFWRW